MYSLQQYNAMAAFSLPEIRKARLESVVLQIKALAGSGMDPRCASVVGVANRFCRNRISMLFCAFRAPRAYMCYENHYICPMY